MRLSKKDGVETVHLIKAEADKLIEATYIARQIARNVPTEAIELVRAIEIFTNAAKKFGAEHFDEKGEIKKSPRVKKQEAEAPAP